MKKSKELTIVTPEIMEEMREWRELCLTLFIYAKTKKMRKVFVEELKRIDLWMIQQIKTELNNY